MGKCCKNNTTKQAEPTTKKQAESTAKKLANNLKSSIFCGTKGFLTFNLAFLSYLEYSICKCTSSAHIQQKENIERCNNIQASKLALAEDTDSNFATQEIEQKEKIFNQQHKFLRDTAAFAMKRNTIPFFEMMIIVPFVCFALPVMVGSISLIQCALVCAALMITTCFVVRTFNLREKLMEKITNHSREEIDAEFKKDTIKFPIFNQNRKHIEYNSPNPGQLLNDSTSLFVKVLFFPLKALLKVLQSCIMLSLAAVELLETVPSLFVDTFFDWSFTSTKSNLQKSGHLLYTSVRNLVPITKFDECVANFIGTPEVTCCK
ncbi:hypothetical protein [Wolbachia endosymbiont of Drosophila tsacasi]|uniref:hypothetical protein n=1 Tax=Wolbachia endosymbiont of Drosophila tsacasi TaxID=3002579 RepID=UPI0023AA05E2|nr:hypothetical protein [Wolbachia endosymbiont of Drosophila tsacasi]MDE5062764.1 hypothetical protein [Wolbachia endosymbiont of Drosophila tsacasi]